MAVEMKPVCERCSAPLAVTAEAFICSYECTFCKAALPKSNAHARTAEMNWPSGRASCMPAQRAKAAKLL
jgi:hypothetical protein